MKHDDDEHRPPGGFITPSEGHRLSATFSSLCRSGCERSEFPDTLSKIIRARNLKTSRRDFFKTGAAFASAALLGEAFNAAFASAAGENPQDLKDVELLFVQNAKDVVMKNGRLTLIGVSATTIFFSDRPKRIAGHMHTEDFVLEWQKGTGPESFRTDPPNGALSIFAEDHIVDVVVELKNPRLAGGALVYNIDVLEQDEPIPSGPVSLFIDPIGRPLTPGSVAGVRRRTRRRTRRRVAVLH